MIATEGILFATDFSTQSEWVGAVARDTASGLDTTLHVIHVVAPPTDLGDAGERLARVASSLSTGGRVKTALLRGRVARQIVEYARSHGVRMIVIGTHGRTGVSRALLGSVAEAVVRLASCPVLTVPPVAVDGATDVPEAYRCAVCGAPSDDLICETCRALIRGGAQP